MGHLTYKVFNLHFFKQHETYRTHTCFSTISLSTVSPSTMLPLKRKLFIHIHLYLGVVKRAHPVGYAHFPALQCGAGQEFRSSPSNVCAPSRPVFFAGFSSMYINIKKNMFRLKRCSVCRLSSPIVTFVLRGGPRFQALILNYARPALFFYRLLQGGHVRFPPLLVPPLTYTIISSQ